MSWSLQLHNGDLAVSGAQLGVVTDEVKMTQDLRCALLERMGNDDMHATFGSLIDGGILSDGTVVPSLIGTPGFDHTAARVQSEINRIAGLYQDQQLNRAKSDRIIYSRVSLTPGEVLIAISGVVMSQQDDALIVQVTLTSARGQDINLVFPLLAQ